MNEFDTILKVGQFLYKEDILSPFGYKILHNELIDDIQSLKPSEQQKLVRICLYLTIVINMTLLFGGWIAEHKSKEWDEEFELLRTISLDIEKTLPNYLKGLNDYHLEKYHEAKTGIFVKNFFELYQHIPIHPAEQRFHDIMEKAKEAS